MIVPVKAPYRHVSPVDDESMCTWRTYKIVNADYNTFQTTAGIAKRFQPVLIADNARKDTLVVSEQNEGQLSYIVSPHGQTMADGGALYLASKSNGYSLVSDCSSIGVLWSRHTPAQFTASTEKILVYHRSSLTTFRVQTRPESRMERNTKGRRLSYKQSPTIESMMDVAADI